jgi:hypothetical protein
MNNLITKINFVVDIDQVNADLSIMLKHFHWTLPTSPVHNQIGLRHRPSAENIWLDASGSLYNKELKRFTGQEGEFSEWNPYLPNYTKSILEQFMIFENIKIGRARFMLAPPRHGLTVHKDFEKRYHLVLRTNPNAFFGEKVDEGDLVAKCYHLPADGHFYKVDTTKEHFIYNGGTEDRIHMVLNIA